MTTTLISIAALAALFAIYGMLRPKSQCGSQCTLCKSPCQRAQEEKNA
jgi:hypothetical protein